MSLILLAYLLIAYFYSHQTNLSLNKLRYEVNHSGGWLLVNFLLWLIFIIVSTSLLKIVFAFLVVSHAAWLGLGGKNRIKFVIFLTASLIIFSRQVYPNFVTHNLFITAAIVWLGPYMVSLKILNKKRFIALSIILFIYDIIYVWITPLAQAVNDSANSSGFPLGLIYKANLVGTADLFWISMIFVILNNKKAKLWAIVLLLGIDLLLAFSGKLLDRDLFIPLLVYWVPIGILLTKFDKLIIQR